MKKRKIIVISGGSDGLGKAIAEKLSLKHTVVILARQKEKLDVVAKQFRCEGIVCDVSDAGAVENAVAKILKKHKRIDCVINNAGLWVQGTLESNSPSDIKHLLEVNVLGTLLLTHAVLPAMKKQGSGLILNVNSQAGLYGKAERSVYHTSKWAITGFTKSLALELAPFNIAVTGLYPGQMKTDIFRKYGIEKDESKAISTQSVARTVEFVIETDPSVMFPEIGIKHVGQ